MPVAKPEFIRGNRGRETQMTCGDAMRYLGTSREEKGRESSILLDAYGHEVSIEEAVKLMGGEDATYHNSIWNISDADREFLEERFGGRKEAQRAMALILLERTDAKDGLAAIHDHGEDGWHFHISRKDLPGKKLYGEYGLFQRVWDREMEALRGEAGRPITDWDAHQEYKRNREELAKVQVEQRLLAKDRFMALRTTPDQDDKRRIREEFEAKELALIKKRRELELATADARYRSRGTQGKASHRIEIERIEARAATAVTRLESRNLGQDLKVDRVNAWAKFREPEEKHKALLKILKAEKVSIEKQHQVELEEARQRAERAGALGGTDFERDIALIDAKRDAAVETLRQKTREINAQHQRTRTLLFAIGPLSRTFLEMREKSRLETLAEERVEMEVRHTNRRHEIAGTLGSEAHQKDLDRARMRHQESEERNKVAYLNGFQAPRAYRLIAAAVKASRARSLTKERENLEISWARQDLQESLRKLEETHARRGTLDGPDHRAEVRVREASLEKRIQDIQLRASERRATSRQPILRTAIARGPLGRAAVELVEGKRLLSEARARHGREVTDINVRHQKAGSLGSDTHKAELKVADAKLKEERGKIRGRGRHTVKEAVVGKGRQAVRRSTATLKDAAQKAVQAVRKDLRPVSEKSRAERSAEAGIQPATGAAREAAKAVLAMSQEAAASAAKVGRELAVHGAMASSKMAVGILTAIPSGGASLKVAAKEAGRDLAEGAKGATKEGLVGVKNVSREGGAGLARTSMATLRGVKGLAEELLPQEGAAALKATQEASKTIGKVGLSVLRLDATGAGKEAVLGGLKSAKELSAAAVEAAKLPGVLKLPLQITEKLPVVGQLVSIVRGAAEVTATATKGMELGL